MQKLSGIANLLAHVNAGNMHIRISQLKEFFQLVKLHAFKNSIKRKNRRAFLSVFFAALVLTAGTSHSQTLLKDDFLYNPIDSLEGTGGWYRSGLNRPYNIRETSPDLPMQDMLEAAGATRFRFLIREKAISSSTI